MDPAFVPGFLLGAIMDEQKPKITLSMIVKNEEHVIKRCLDSVIKLISSAVFHDTGSHDKTMHVITAYMRSYPNVAYMLKRAPWHDFAVNRNLAMRDAKTLNGDYIMTMDADDVFEGAPSTVWASIHTHKADVYDVNMMLGTTGYKRPFMWKRSINCQYIGAVHEYLSFPGGMRTHLIEDAHIEAHVSGRRSALEDAAALQDGEDTRSKFYYAQSLYDAGQTDLALDAYRVRAAMDGGYQQETWYSLYRIGRITGKLDDAIAAYRFDPTRPEPLFWAAMNFPVEDPVRLMLLRQAENTLSNVHTDHLFIEKALYDYLIHVNLAASLSRAGQHKEAYAINISLLDDDSLPPDIRELVASNIKFDEVALAE